MAKLKGGSRVYGTLTVDTALTVSTDATITGNLIVSGNTVYTNVETLAVEDPLISLGGGVNAAPLTSNDNKDRGLQLQYYTDSAKTAFMGWDASSGEFAVASNVTISNEVVTSFTYGNLKADYFVGNGYALSHITGANVDGTVASATSASTAGTVTASAQGNITSLGTLTGLDVSGTTDLYTLNSDGVVTLSNTTAATSTTTGALVVAGGVGVGGNLHVGGTITGSFSGSTSAPGSDTQVVFNDGGTSNATSGMTFNKSTNLLTVTGNVSGGNLTTAGQVVATGNVSGGNLTTAGVVAATGNVSGGNLTTAGKVEATGNVDGGNINTLGLVSAGNVTASNNITATNGNVTAGANVVATGNVSGGNVTTTGRVSTANFTITGDVTGHLIPSVDITYDLGNATNKWRDLYLSGSSIKLGSQTITSNSDGTNFSNAIFASNATITTNVVSGNVYANSGMVKGTSLEGTLTVASNAQPNITSVGTLTSLSVSGNISGFGAGNGILTDNLFYANGVAWDLQQAAGDTGEIQFNNGDNFSASPNLAFNSTTNVLTVTGNVDATNVNTTGNVVATGNVSGANLTTAGVVTATGNVSGGNLTTAGKVEATGNVSGANLVTAGNVYATGAVNSGNLVSTGNIQITAGGLSGNLGITAPGGVIDVNNARIINLGTPTGSSDAVTKAYVDGVASGLDVKASVRVATTTNIALDDTTTIVDGVTLANGDRVLVKNQTTASENGIYVASTSGAWTRAADMNAAEEFASAFTFVEQGTVNADAGFVCTTNNPVTVGTTAINFTQFSGAGAYQAGEGLMLDGTEFNVEYDNSTIKLDNSNQLYVAGDLTLTTPNIGAATGTSLNVTGNVDAGNNVNITGNANVTGNVNATNFNGNLVGNVQGNISGTFEVTGGAGAIQFANAANKLTTSAALNFNTTGNVLTVGSGGVGEVTTTLITGTITTTSSAQPNITSVGTLTGLLTSGNIAISNAVATNGILSDNYYYSNGTPIDFQTAAGSAGEIQYKDLVTNDLAASATFTFNPTNSVLSVGNVKVSSLTATHVLVAGTDGKLEGSSGLTFGSSNLIVTGNVHSTGQVMSANVRANNLTATRVVFAGADGLLVDNSNLTFATDKLTTVNIDATGKIDVTGNITGANIYANSGTIGATTLTGTLSTAAQTNITSVGTLTGLTVNGITDLGPDSNVRISGGTAGQFLKATDSSGNLEWATIDSSIIANGTSNVTIAASGGNVDTNVGGSLILRVSGTGANVTGTIDVTGNVDGNNINAANLITADANVDSTSSITGTVKVTGGIGATGNIYTGKSIGFANNNGGTASAAYIQFNAASNSLDFIFN